MALTRDEIIRLLQIAGCYDYRTPAQGTVIAWEDSARRGRWTFEEAADAIKTHYLHSTEFVMPGHVTLIVRAARQDAAMRASTGGRPALHVIDGGWPAGDDPHRGRRNSSELEQLHADTNVVPCRQCAAEIGHRCTHTVTGNATKIPHTKRLGDAHKARKAQSSR